MQRNYLAALALGVVLALSSTARAQMNNEPFSFGGSDGLGMSDAARQALINKKLFGVTPDNILRGPGGTLLEVSPTPGGHAVIVTTQGGETLPGYHGRGLELGGFAPFFEIGASDGGGISFFVGGTGLTISGWTFGLIADGDGRTVMMPPAGASSIDVWTAQVSGLSAL